MSEKTVYANLFTISRTADGMIFVTLIAEAGGEQIITARVAVTLDNGRQLGETLLKVIDHVAENTQRN
jgi:hypothetical protein